MPAPDITRPSRVEAKMAIVQPAASTSAITLVTCPADASVRLRTLYICNRTASTATFTTRLVRSGVTYTMHNSLTVPANNVFVALAGEDAHWLESGDVFEVIQPTANSLNVMLSYEVVT